MKAIRFVLACLLLSGCAALGLGNLSLDEKLASAQVTEASVVNATATAVAAGTVTADQGQKVLDTAKTMDGFIGAARVAAASGNTTAANQQLALAIGVLEQLQLFINQQAVKK